MDLWQIRGTESRQSATFDLQRNHKTKTVAPCETIILAEGEDPGMVTRITMQVERIKSGVLYRSQNPVFRYNACPTAGKMGDGTLAVAFSGHRIGHGVLRDADDGHEPR